MHYFLIPEACFGYALNSHLLDVVKRHCSKAERWRQSIYMRDLRLCFPYQSRKGVICIVYENYPIMFRFCHWRTSYLCFAPWKVFTVVLFLLLSSIQLQQRYICYRLYFLFADWYRCVIFSRAYHPVKRNIVIIDLLKIFLAHHCAGQLTKSLDPFQKKISIFWTFYCCHNKTNDIFDFNFLFSNKMNGVVVVYTKRSWCSFRIS